MKNIGWFLLMILLAGCAVSPAPQFYLLEARSKPPVSSGTLRKNHIIGLGPTTLAAVLERKTIVTRTALNRIEFSELHQWAAPLKATVPEVISQNLTRLLPTDTIRIYPWNAYNDVQYRVLVHISRFDSTPKVSTNLEANWAVIDEQTHATVKSGQSILHAPLLSTAYQDNVAGLNSLLDRFSQELAVVIAGLP